MTRLRTMARHSLPNCTMGVVGWVPGSVQCRSPKCHSRVQRRIRGVNDNPIREIGGPLDGLLMQAGKACQRLARAEKAFCLSGFFRLNSPVHRSTCFAGTEFPADDRQFARGRTSKRKRCPQGRSISHARTRIYTATTQGRALGWGTERISLYSRIPLGQGGRHDKGFPRRCGAILCAELWRETLQGLGRLKGWVGFPDNGWHATLRTFWITTAKSPDDLVSCLFAHDGELQCHKPLNAQASAASSAARLPFAFSKQRRRASPSCVVLLMVDFRCAVAEMF